MPDQNSTYKEKLDALRAGIVAQGVDGFIVPRADEYQGEFVAAYAKRLSWLTGFTGSAGVAVVLADRAVVLTDGRYIIQVAQEVDSDLYETGDSTRTTLADWLQENAGNRTIGYDPWLHTPKQIKAIEEKFQGNLKAVEVNLVDQIWRDQPDCPGAKVEIFPEDIAGRSCEDKRMAIAEALSEAGAYAAILTLPDSIAWLLNVRGGDVDNIPVALSYAVIDRHGAVQWFIESGKVSDDVRAHIGNAVQVTEPEKLEDCIGALAQKSEGPVALDFKHSPAWFKAQLEGQGATVLDMKDPCILPKSIKTGAEQRAIRAAHMQDGVAMVRFLAWLDREGGSGNLTELNVGEKIDQLRAQEPGYRGPSFPAIAGFGPNGAIVHYRATEQSNQAVEPPGLLLVDSGGQYRGGTTDITRTVAIGEPSQEMKENFTRVLQGHIAVASARFAVGTTGKEIDALARKPLQEVGLDFAHGTGHGVGCYLQVHEEAANLSPRGEEAPQAGMLISNEPGYYKEGAYGIRIENLVLVQEAEDGELFFDTVSLAPIDTNLIVADMLSVSEMAWLNGYHATVRGALEHRLQDQERVWLKEKTKAL